MACPGSIVSTRTLPDDQGRPTDWLEDRESIDGLLETSGRIGND
jgi:hypothetical protein